LQREEIVRMAFIVSLINVLTQVIVLLILAKVILSYFMSPYHPIRQTIDRIVEPMLAPIRRVIPPIGMIDFSPLVLLILIQIVGRLLINILFSLS
jgi:YggT family protein